VKTEREGGAAVGSDSPPRPTHCLAQWNAHTFCCQELGHELPHIAFDPISCEQVMWPTVIGGLFHRSPGGWYRCHSEQAKVEDAQ
jgi:hypothetical protein